MCKKIKILICIIFASTLFNISFIQNNFFDMENVTLAAIVARDPTMESINDNGSAACEHANCKWTITKKPTCTEKGFREYRCLNCEIVVKSEEMNKKDHDYVFTSCETQDQCSMCGAKTGIPSGHPGFIPATCYSAPTCMRCGKKVGTALPHKFVYKKIDSTWDIGTCSVCNYTRSMEMHNIKDGKCQRCGFVKYEKCTHEPKWVTTKEATCKEDGVKSLKCEACNITSKTEIIPKTGHKYAYRYLDGINHNLFCENCDYVSKVPHIFDDNKCKFCGYTKLSQTENDILTPEQIVCKHSYRWVVTIPATCQKTGSTSYVCRKCNSVKKVKEISKVSHKFTIKATCTSAKKCSMCDETSGKPLNHSLVYEAISNDQVNHKVRCKVCDYEEKVEHTYNKNNKCTKCKYTKASGNTKENQETCNHKYIKATCTTPKICEYCEKVSSIALGHSRKYTKIENNAKTHKVTCRRCDLEEEEEHIFNTNGVCTRCKYKKEAPKCTSESIIEGHELTVKKSSKLAKTNRYYTSLHNVLKYCATCKKTITVIENHGNFDKKGKCACGYIDPTKIECTRSNFTEGHDVEKLGYEERVNYHVINYHCNTCGVDTIRTETHKYVDEVCVCGRTSTVKICKHSTANLKVIKTEKMDDAMSKKHWNVIKCSICGAESRELASHMFNEGIKCSCGTKFAISATTTSTGDGKNIVLTPGSSAKITVIHNSDLVEEFTFKSNNSKVTVTKDGVVTLNKDVKEAFKTKIIITSKSFSSVKTSIPVEVSLNKANLIVEGPTDGFVSTPMDLTAKLEGNLTDSERKQIEQTIKWTTNKTNGSLSNSKGTKTSFTPAKTGKVEISVSATISGKTITRKITININKVVFKDAKDKMTLMLNESMVLQGVQGLSKISGNSVKLNGNVLIGQSLGTSIFKDSKGNKYEITVTDKVIYIKSIKLSVDKSTMFVGDSARVTIKVSPENATETYTISTQGGISYNGDGTISANSVSSKATITVKSDIKDIKVQKTINVINEELELKTKNMVLGLNVKGAKVPVNLAKLKADTQATLTYKSSNTSIVEVKADGTIIPKKASEKEAKITVTANVPNGSNGRKTVSKSCFVIINDLGYSKLDKNVYHKPGTGKSTEIIIYIPGSGVLCGPNGEHQVMPTEKADVYFNDGKTYENDVIFYDSYTRNNSFQAIRDCLFEQYGVSSVEEFNAKGYTISPIGFSQGGTIAIDLAYQFKEMGFNVESITVLDAYNKQMVGKNGSSGLTAMDQVREMMKEDEDLKFSTISSDQIRSGGSAGLTYQLGSEMHEKYPDRTTTTIIPETVHNTLVWSEQAGEILDSAGNNEGFYEN